MFQIMKDQPKTEQLVRKFFWCQWDAMHQRLYYIHYRKHSEGEKNHFQAILSSIQFYQNAQHDNTVSSLPFIQLKVLQYFRNICW